MVQIQNQLLECFDIFQDAFWKFKMLTAEYWSSHLGSSGIQCWWNKDDATEQTLVSGARRKQRL